MQFPPFVGIEETPTSEWPHCSTRGAFFVLGQGKGEQQL